MALKSGTVLGQGTRKKSSLKSGDIIGQIDISSTLNRLRENRVSSIAMEYDNGKWWDEETRREYSTELGQYLADIKTAQEYYESFGDEGKELSGGYDWSSAYDSATSLKSLVDDEEYWVQFGGQEDYTSYLKGQKAQAERNAAYLAFDTVTGEQELADIKHQIMVEIPKQVQEWMDKYRSTSDPALKKQYFEQARALEEKSYELEQEYKEKKSFLNGAKDYQTFAKYLQGYKGYMDYINAEDYAANSQYVSTRTDVAKEDAVYKRGNMWGTIDDAYDPDMLFGDYQYDYINRNQDALDVAKVNDTGSDSSFFGFDRSFLQTMTKEEIGVYNYLYKTQGKDAANAFLSFIESDLNGRERAREEAKWAADAKEDPVGSSVFSVLITPMKGLSYLFQTADMLDDGKMVQNAGYNRFSYIPSAIRSQVSTTIENSGKWGKVGSFAYNTGMSMADFLFTTAVSGGNQAISLAIMGTGAAADATLAAKDRGLDDGQAFTLGTIAGLAEVAMEKISLGAWLEGDMSEGALRYVLKNALSEGSEEAGTSLVNLLADVIIAGDKSEWNIAIQAYIDEGKSPEEAFGLVAAKQAAQMGLDFLGGALSGAAISGGTYGTIQGSNAIQNYREGGQILNADGGLGALKELAYDLHGAATESTQNDISKLADKVTDKKGIFHAKNQMNTGKLYKTVRTAVTEQNATDVAKSLERKGYSSEQAKKIAGAISVYFNGIQMTAEQAKLLQSVANDEKVQQTINDIVNNPKSTASQTRQKVNQFVGEVNKNAASHKAESKYEVSKEGKTTLKSDSAKTIDAYEIADIKDDKVTLRIQSGATVPADDVIFSSNSEALVIEAFADVGMDVEAANAFLQSMSGTKMSSYLGLGIKEVFRYAKAGYPMEAMSDRGFGSALTKTQKEYLYTLAKEQSKNEADSAQSKVDEQFEKATKYLESKGLQHNKHHGRVTYVDKKAEQTIAELENRQKKGGKLSAKERRQIETVKASKVLSYITGLDFVLTFRGTGKNGSYNPVTNTIEVDLLAGADANSLSMYTISHELLHFCKEVSPAQYEVFCKLVMDAFSRSDAFVKGGWTLDMLIQNQINDAKKDGLTYDWDQAYEEVIADACESLLVDGGFEQLLAKVREEDIGLWRSLKRFFKGLLADLKVLVTGYQEVTPDSVEAKIIRSMTENVQSIVDAFSTMVADASVKNATIRAAQDAGMEVEMSNAIKSEFGDITVKNATRKKGTHEPGSYFVEDKYYARQIDKWDTLKGGSYITAGKITTGSPINQVGVPDGALYFDAYKIQAEMSNHDDHLSSDVMKKIPQMLDDPIVITEYKPGAGENTISVYGKLTTEKGTPVVVGIVITKGRGKNVVSKIRTVHARSDFQRQITDKSVLFLGENKKETKAWFQALGIDVPLGGNKFGFIRMLPQNLDSVKADDIEKHFGGEKNSTRIKRGMTDEERYNILKDKKITLTAKVNSVKMAEAERKLNQDFSATDILLPNDRKKLFKKLGEEFGVFKGYKNKDISLDFTFSKGNIKESLKKQKRNYQSFAKMLTCFDDVIDTAIGIEIHNRNDEGYKVDPTLKNMYVLVSAFEDGDSVVPVKLEIKEFDDKENTLYIAIALESIKKDEVVTGGDTIDGVTQTARSSIVSLTNLFGKINPLDKNFTKYIPKQFLDSTTANGVEKNSTRKEKDYSNLSYEGLPADAFYNEDYSYIYSYDFLIAQKDMTVVDSLPALQELQTEGKIDSAKVLDAGYKNILEMGGTKVGNTYSIINTYTNRPLQIGKNSITHGLGAEDINAKRTNARLAAVIGELCKNAIPICALPNTHNVRGTYGMAALVNSHVNGKDMNMIALITVERQNGNVQSVDFVDVAHAVSGRLVRDIEKENRSAQGTPPGTKSEWATRFSSTIKIPQFLDIVNRTHQGYLSDDVISKLGEERRGSKKALYSTRKESTSNRCILSNASESTAQNAVEKEWLVTYKASYAEVKAIEQQLQDINRQIGEICFGTGKRDTEKLTKLKNNQKTLTNKLNRLDSKLLQIEASKPLADLLKREKARTDAKNKTFTAKAVRDARLAGDMYWGRKLAETEEHYKERMKTQREKLNERNADKLAETREYYHGVMDRKKDSQNRTDMRHKIKGIVKDIDKLLNRGNKDRNVKKGLEETISKALAVADVLFSPTPSNAEVLSADIADMSAAEEAAVKDFLGLVEKRDALTEQIARIRKAVEMSEDYAVEWNKAQPQILALQSERDSVKEQINKLSREVDPVIERARRKIEDTTTVDIALQDLANAYKELENTAVKYLQGAYDDFTYEYILMLKDELKGVKLKNMDGEQLKQVYDMFKMMRTTIRDANKVFLNGKKQERSALGYSTVDEITMSGKKAKDNRSDMLEAVRKFGWNALTIDTVLEIINSDTLKKCVADIKDAQGVYFRDMEDAKNFYAKVAKETGYFGWDTKAMEEFTASDGKTFSINLEGKMLLYAYAKRQQALSHLKGKGFSLRGAKAQGKVGTNTVTDNTTYIMMADKIAEVTDTLTKEQKQYVEQLQEYLSKTMGAKGNEVSDYLYGIDLFVEEYYVPLLTDSQFLDPKDADKNRKGVTGFRRKNSGFTKAVVKNAEKAIILGSFTEVWSGHVLEMANYHSMVIPMETFEKVLSFHDDVASVRGTIEHYWGKEAYQYFRDYLDDLNGGIQTDNQGGLADKLTSVNKMTAVALSASVVVQQPTAVFRAMAEIDPKYFLIAPKKPNYEQLKQYSNIAGIKQMGGFDARTSRSSSSWLTAQEFDGIVNKAKGLLADKDYRQEAYFWAARKADEVTWCWIWEAVIRETKAKHPGLPVGSKAFMETAGKRFDDVVSRTQVYDSVVSKSGLMRSTNERTKMATAFMAEPTVAINNLVYGVAKGKHMGGMAGAMFFARTATAVVTAQIAASFAKAFIQAARDDDDDETYLEKYGQAISENMVTEVLLMIPSSIPFLRDIVTMEQGWGVERTDMALIGDLIDAVKGWDSERRTTEEKIEKTAYALANLLGIPLRNVMRDLKALVNFFNTVYR